MSRGEFALAGLRNRDLRGLLYPANNTAAEQRRQAAISTLANGCCCASTACSRKSAARHRWLLTDQGLRIITALPAARQGDDDQLTKMAA